MPLKSRKEVGSFYHDDQSTKWIEKGKKREEEEIVTTEVVSIKKQETVDDTQLAVDKNKFDTKTLNEEELKNPLADLTKNIVAVAADDSSTEDAKNGSASATANKSNDDTEEIGFDDKSKSKDTSNKWVQVDRSNWNGPRPPFPTLDGGCRLCMCNLSPSVEESDVRNFFKDDGNVANVEFFIVGYGRVRFETHDEARKAIKRHGEELLGYPIKLYFTHDDGFEAFQREREKLRALKEESERNCRKPILFGRWRGPILRDGSRRYR